MLAHRLAFQQQMSEMLQLDVAPEVVPVRFRLNIVKSVKKDSKEDELWERIEVCQVHEGLAVLLAADCKSQTCQRVREI